LGEDFRLRRSLGAARISRPDEPRDRKAPDALARRFGGCATKCRIDARLQSSCCEIASTML
jgi:hypothetical protein